jgi:hypothetical protein
MKQTTLSVGDRTGSWRRVGLVGALAAAVLASGLPAEVAQAQTRDPVAGEALFREGRRLMKTQDYTGACAKFEESQRLDPAVGTVLNLAECEEQQGHTAKAWQFWHAAADQLPSGDKRRPVAQGRAAALDKVLARLSITLVAGVPEGTQVSRDGVALGPASLGIPIPVDPGKHVLVVSAPGHSPRTFDVTVASKEQASAKVEPGPALSSPKPPDPVDSPARPPSTVAHPAPPPVARAGGSGTAYVFLGVGAAALATGGVFWLRARDARQQARNQCVDEGDAHTCGDKARAALDREKRSSLLADVGFGVGAVAVATGIYFLLRPTERAAPVSATLVPRWAGGEVQLAVRF